MTHNKSKPSPTLKCIVCGTHQTSEKKFEGTKICEDCFETGREGRDSTTRAVKSQVTLQRDQAQAARTRHNGCEIDEKLEYNIASAEVFLQDSLVPDQALQMGAGAEVVPQHDLELNDTLAAPDAAALDASANRLELVTMVGTNVAAMAVDAAQTVGASNSIEKMYCHQLAVLHNTSMQMMSKAALETDPVTSMKMMNIGIRAAEVFQRGSVNIRKLRGASQQVMRIEHIHIAPGAQAIVGPVQTGGKA